ncbi:MAG: T9SS type A sorting domain-containing protein [Elusimicrobiota bacterium]
MRFRQRCSAFAFFLLACPASFAAAQQVFVSRMWVQYPEIQCDPPDSKQHIHCDDTSGVQPLGPGSGNISNDPHIEFSQPSPLSGKADCEATPAVWPYGDNSYNVCNNQVFLCIKVGHSNKQSGSTSFALDYISFEVFKYGEGSNPLDPQSTPPLRTFYVDNPGQIPADTNSDTDLWSALPPMCVMWDGNINIKGEFGKSNGQYGFRATVATNQTGASGNINITQTRAFPGGWALDVNNDVVDTRPITVDVTDVHVVRSTPTVVGTLTGVAAEPYNITYRLSKDATMYLSIHMTNEDMSTPLVRAVVNALPRVGEGVPSGTLQNGDSWNGRHDNGDLVTPGVYLAKLEAISRDQYGWDRSHMVTRQVALDTLEITDIRVQPLTDLATSLAVLSYVLTEPATAYVDIYPPGTKFLTLNNLNTMADVAPGTALALAGVKKNFVPVLNGAEVLPVRHIEEQKDYRKSVISFWDGRNSAGRVVEDGDYVFVLYASLPSQNGYPFNGNTNDKRIWATNAKSGFLTVTRGMVTISQIGPSSTVIGSSPPVAGLDPFTFSYSLSRDAIVSLKILDSTGLQLIRTLVNEEQRPGNFLNRERWVPPTNNSGLVIASGTYMVQLTARDPLMPSKVSTTTAFFPVDLFRITDVNVTPLLTGSTDVVTLSYQLSQPMRIAWNVYPPGTVINSGAGWPPCGTLEPPAGCAQITNGSGGPVSPLITIKGMRPGRLRITEFWDGRDVNGLFVPDGSYVYLLTAESTTTPKYFATDKVVGDLTVARGSIIFPIFNITPTFPALFNSSQTISLPPYEIDYSLTRQSSVTISILTTDSAPQTIRTLISGQVRDANILNREFWDARNDAGNFVSPGFYTVRAVAEDLASVMSSGSTAQQTVSVDPLRIYDVAISPLRPDFGTALIAYQVSETMKVSLKIYKPKTVFDPNGNPTPPESVSLVKRIVGVRPARTEISEIWDGTDEALSPVPDGNYLFKIVASTDVDAIHSRTGDVKAGAALAEDLIISEIPVVLGAVPNPDEYFEKYTYMYPNPVGEGGSAKIHIFVPLESNVSVKIYNIAGELVWTRDLGLQSSSTETSGAGSTSGLECDWDLENDAGRAVAPGVYFVLVRAKSTKGDMSLFQTVKKVLVK